MCGDRGGQMQKGPRKTCFVGKANPIPATIQKQLVQSDGLFLRFPVRKRGLAPLTQGRKRGAAPHHFPRLMKGCPLSFPVPVQKEEGLREEHGSARQIARGPLCGAAMAFPQKRPRSGGSRFVRRPRRSNAKGPPQNLFCGERKSRLIWPALWRALRSRILFIEEVGVVF